MYKVIKHNIVDKNTKDVRYFGSTIIFIGDTFTECVNFIKNKIDTHKTDESRFDGCWVKGVNKDIDELKTNPTANKWYRLGLDCGQIVSFDYGLCNLFYHEYMIQID